MILLGMAKPQDKNSNGGEEYKDSSMLDGDDSEVKANKQSEMAAQSGTDQVCQ